jgi:hypothetical protein
MDQVLERLFDGGVTWFCRQFRKPPVQDSGLCVLCIWILAQVFPDRPHSLSYARFMHHTFHVPIRAAKEQYLDHAKKIGFSSSKKMRAGEIYPGWNGK